MFEAVGACAAGKITEAELGEIERKAIPCEGACAGMFTANTMASIAEAIGMSLPGSASPPAVDRRRDDDAHAAGRAVMGLVAAGITARDIMTKEAFENAISIVNAVGGSTNAVLHLLAVANEAGVRLDLDDFNRVAARVPHIADMKPGGKFHMSDLDRIGGVPVVLKHLLDAGLLHGDAMTVTGRTMAENLTALDPPEPDGVVVHPLSSAIDVEGGINVLTGTLAPQGSVVKVAGLSHAQRRFEGAARVFEGEEPALDAILAGTIVPGTVLVIRYEGPKGGPGMREMLAVTGALEGGRPGRRLRAGHRRPLLGRHVGLLHRPRRTRGRRRRAHRLRPRRRPDPRRRRHQAHRPRSSTRPSWPPAGGAGRRWRPATPPACWPSTPAWCPAPRPGPSPPPPEPTGSRVSGVRPSPSPPLPGRPAPRRRPTPPGRRRRWPRRGRSGA